VSAAEDIAKQLRSGGSYVIVIKSTVPPEAVAIVRKVVSENVQDVVFSVAHNPEFLAEGSALNDMMRPSRTVIGVSEKWAEEKLTKLYLGVSGKIFITDPVSASLIKYGSNAFLATKISFANKIAGICELSGANAKDVLKGIGLDPRIGPDFFGFGLGYGGSCLPKDTEALGALSNKLNQPLSIMHAAMEVNKRLPEAFVSKIIRRFGRLDKLCIACWGLSFKPNTDDTRESPAYSVIRRLRGEGAFVTVYDPRVSREKVINELGESGIEIFDDPYLAVRNVDALCILTDWPEFEDVNFKKVLNSMVQTLIFDGRNMLDPENMRTLGFEYYGFGM